MPFMTRTKSQGVWLCELKNYIQKQVWAPKTCFFIVHARSIWAEYRKVLLLMTTHYQLYAIELLNMWKMAPCNIVCLQEAKLVVVDSFVASFLGGQRLKSFAERPANGTKGGILLLWNADFIKVDSISFGTFFISAMITLVNSTTSFKLTSVYGPTRSNLKDALF